MIDRKESYVDHPYPKRATSGVWQRYLRVLNSKLPRPFYAWDYDELNESGLYRVTMISSVDFV